MNQDFVNPYERVPDWFLVPRIPVGEYEKPVETNRVSTTLLLVIIALLLK